MANKVMSYDMVKQGVELVYREGAEILKSIQLNGARLFKVDRINVDFREDDLCLLIEFWGEDYKIAEYIMEEDEVLLVDVFTPTYNFKKLDDVVEKIVKTIQESNMPVVIKNEIVESVRKNIGVSFAWLEYGFEDYYCVVIRCLDESTMEWKSADVQ